MKRAKKLVALLLTVCMLVIILAGCSGSQNKGASAAGAPAGERTEPLKLKIGGLGSGREDDVQSYPISKFIEEVKTRSNGKILIEHFPDGQLGGEPDMMDQVLSDTLDFGCLSTNVLATVWPELYVYNLPFAFPTLKDFWTTCGMDSTEFINAISSAVDSTGKAKFISSFSAEFRGCQNTKHEIRSPKDFKGLTFRVMAGEIFTDIFRALGASTATVPFAELYTSLQQGVVDGEDIGISMFYDQKFYEVEKYSTQFNITPTVNALIVSNGAWAKLNEEERKIIIESAKVAEEYGYSIVSTKLTGKYFEPLKEKGVTVIKHEDLTEAELNECRDAVQKVWDKFKPIVGEKVYNAFVSAVDKAKEASK